MIRSLRSQHEINSLETGMAELCMAASLRGMAALAVPLCCWKILWGVGGSPEAGDGFNRSMPRKERLLPGRKQHSRRPAFYLGEDAEFVTGSREFYGASGDSGMCLAPKRMPKRVRGLRPAAAHFLF